MAAQISVLRRKRERGSEVLEFTFIMVLVLGFLFMTIDVAWMVFTRATLQHAVFRGARYAMASRSNFSTLSSHKASIKQAVKDNALGLLNGDFPGTPPTPKASKIYVRWYAQSDLNTALPEVDGNNRPGTVVEVSVEDYSTAPLLGVFHDRNAFHFTARSSDRMD